MSSELVYVRLAPYAPRQGNHVTRHVVRGQLFEGGDKPKWYSVSKEFADQLLEEHQIVDDPRSRPLFEVMNKEQMESIQLEEHRRALAAIGAYSPTVQVPQIRPPEVIDGMKRLDAITSDEVSGRAAALAPERQAEEVKPLTEDELEGGVTTYAARSRRPGR
jgi:hypothetical protein